MPTIKYYIREGLLGSGERVNDRRTEYADDHLHRLRLIRALVDVGGLPISSVHAVLAALDDDRLPIGNTFDVAQKALIGQNDLDDEPSADSLARVDAMAQRAGWTHSAASIGRVVTARVLDSFARLGQPVDDAYLDAYAGAATQVAAADLDSVAAVEDRMARTELVVIGTVLGDTLSAGLRRIAHAHATAERGMLS